MEKYMKVLSTCMAVIFLASTVFAAPISANRFQATHSAFSPEAQQAAKDQYGDNFASVLAGRVANEGFEAVVTEFLKNVGYTKLNAAGLQTLAALIKVKESGKSADVAGLTADQVANALKSEQAFASVVTEIVSNQVIIGALLGNQDIAAAQIKYSQDNNLTAQSNNILDNTVGEAGLKVQVLQKLYGDSIIEDGTIVISDTIAALLSDKGAETLVKILALPKVADMQLNGKAVKDYDAAELGDVLLKGVIVHEKAEAANKSHLEAVKAANDAYPGFDEVMNAINLALLMTDIVDGKDAEKVAVEAGATLVAIQASDLAVPQIVVDAEMAEALKGTIAEIQLNALNKMKPNVVVFDPKNLDEVLQTPNIIYFTTKQAVKLDNGIVVSSNKDDVKNVVVNHQFNSLLMKLLEMAKQSQVGQYDLLADFASILGVASLQILDEKIAPAIKYALQKRMQEISA